MTRSPQKLLTVRMFFQLLLMWGLVVGPHGSLEALMLLDGDCATSCPCDSEEAEPQKVDNKRCSDDCADCDCDASFVVAVAPSPLATEPARIPDAREATLQLLPIQGELQDIFIPPRQ